MADRIRLCAMAAVVSVRSGKQLRAAVSLVKLCCFLYFLSVSESRALRASAANVLLSGFLTKPRCQSFPKGPVRWLCPDWPLLSSLPFVFSQTESLPNAGSSSQEHWLSTGTPEQPFVASWKERCGRLRQAMPCPSPRTTWALMTGRPTPTL